MEQGSTTIRRFVEHLEIKEEFGDKKNNFLNAILQWAQETSWYKHPKMNT